MATAIIRPTVAICDGWLVAALYPTAGERVYSAIEGQTADLESG